MNAHVSDKTVWIKEQVHKNKDC